MRYIKIFEEFNYEQHKQDGVQIIDRFLVTINPGTPDVLEVECLLARNENNELMLKPLAKVKIFQSSSSFKLIKDKEIDLSQSHRNTPSAVKVLNDNTNNWLVVSTDNSMDLVTDINVGEVIQVGGKGLSMIGNVKCIFNTIKFEKI
jgi:hypothetical protein